MKKILLFIALFAIATIATAQIKIGTSGQVFMGGYNTTHPQVLLRMEKNGGIIAIGPNDNGSNIGSSLGQIDFWYPSVNGNSYKWNHIKSLGHKLASDSTLKTDIAPIVNATTLLKQLKTYSYFLKSDSLFRSDSLDLRKRDYGILAQEIEEILPELVDTAKGTMFVNYNAFIGILIAGFNEQQTLIETQQNEITTLQNIAYAQEQDLAALKTLHKIVYEMQDILLKCCDNTQGMPMLAPPQDESSPTGETAILYQNTPNPFTSNTEIRCYLPKTTVQATLFIYSLQGAQLLDYSITQAGLSAVTVHGSELPAGMYLYTLVVDNKIMDTKRMILTK